jgi:thymidine kinase
MAKLYFNYSVMNSGKTTDLLQAAYVYKEHGKRVLLITSMGDTRSGTGKISARIGVEADAYPLRTEENLFNLIEAEHAKDYLSAVFLDEVNFMTADHIEQATDVVDYLGIPVMAYGLKNNAFGEIFGPSIAKILAVADVLNEVRNICHCGKAATMILRYGKTGKIERSGNVIEPGGEQRYISVCRQHYKLGDIGQKAMDSLPNYKVHCSHCGKGYDHIFTRNQANDCASYIHGNKISGTYGSAITDTVIHSFTEGRPAHIQNGIVCDPCVQSFLDHGLIKEVRNVSPFS